MKNKPNREAVFANLAGGVQVPLNRKAKRMAAAQAYRTRPGRGPDKRRVR